MKTRCAYSLQRHKKGKLPKTFTACVKTQSTYSLYQKFIDITIELEITLSIQNVSIKQGYVLLGKSSVFKAKSNIEFKNNSLLLEKSTFRGSN